MAHVSAAERRPQLIKAAIDLMAREGVAAGSTRAIAAELGVAQATVHYTFGTKEDLYRAVIQHLTQEMERQVRQAAPDGAGFEETVGVLASALWRTVRNQSRSYQLLTELTMFALRSPHLREALETHNLGVLSVTSELVTDAADRAGLQLAQPAGTIARFFLAGFDGLVLQHLTHPDDEAELSCLQALISSTLALAGGRVEMVAVPRDLIEGNLPSG
ncbi:TetR family transcriptional regulator [Streptomyces sp. NRRL B-1140]|uniref:TetR/AcrR family transcriptional regulator n=1 Tax=Streptomyces sp. NRRL B-1140 TaxID=1415549 RepID=UPI0006AEC4FA|nr:TetR/AcrR family transcriptional regulator [Streptomyces sp. NRRL B-1140]KOX04517.1 TetR family transcriptional regulator [Streptomyces sp. NRRL B-1140]